MTQGSSGESLVRYAEMHRFWAKVVRPILDAIQPCVVVEIGAATGAHTRLLAEHCRLNGVTLHVIDPAPQFDPEELSFEECVVFHQGRSLEFLPTLGAVDVALIDGDHNWYTVNRELHLLQRAAHEAGRPIPVVLCHDVCWPYGRRDLYYDPQSIPAEYRQPWERAGIVREQSSLDAKQGLNAHLCNASHEGGPRNGVMTAIEDFVHSSDGTFSVILLPVLWGLAIIVPQTRLDAHSGLEPLLTKWTTANGWADLALLAEGERERLEAAAQALVYQRRSRASSVEPLRRANTGGIAGRTFRSDLSPDALAGVQRGTLRTTYRGVPFLKSPFDVVLYMDLIGRLRPHTVIEVGTKAGGSAVWFADLLDSHGIDGRVISIDLDNPPDIKDNRIIFLRGDATRLNNVLPASALAGLAHPFLVSEDSAHLFETSLGVLEFFHHSLKSGDYIVVEDGVVAELPGEMYKRYANGPNRAVSHFLQRHPGVYYIDENICDRYGHNVTWAPNAWLCRV